ncbi:HNH endonuclease [Acinetobacter baumannii]|nr:HNH endonuclease [Acinetobacter baumannii]
MKEDFVICQYCEEEYAVDYYSKIHPDVILCNPCANMILEVVHKAQYGQDLFGRKNEERSQKYMKKKIGLKLRLEVYERDGFKCVTCGVQKNLTLDHIKPEILGGVSTIENLQTMCKSCNSSKGTKYDESDEEGE